ncbi:hypothetical protein BJ138DRAFT_1117847 [Hygrophoropsis aurantiaca]|uniref:Uncharacterized protein n=1 Tax=Hygrophoropsis aurantiaca TaxID=72124 RepID=A0ACB7ZZN6_9AGAM|nr:hypothetical protein BJ138DRAFT_1117847 [Hygrophoropsis aurantiaca]
MDQYYNYDAARQDLESFTQKRNEDEERRFFQLCVWDGAMAANCTTFKLPGDRRTMCTVPGKATDDKEEAVFTLQGVISDLDLPPLKNRPRAQHVRHIRQSITLTGLGNQDFEQAVTTLYGLDTLLERQAPPGSIEKWQPTDYAGYTAIDIQNRYFTPKKFANGLPSVPFDDAVDPNGYLKDSVGSELIHTDDNRVEYYSSAVAGAQTVSPSSFRVGDLVEVCLSAVMAPVNAEKHRMIVVLRSLALLESRHTMNGDTNREIAKGNIAFRTVVSKLPKRRRAYATDKACENQPESSTAGKRGKVATASETGRSDAADKQMAVE